MMKATTVSHEKLLDDHLELRDAIARLRERLESLDPKGGKEAAQHWASGIAEDLVRLHEALVVHFSEEDASGFFEELTLEFPEHSRRLEALAAEHVELLADSRGIVSAFLEYSETGSGSASELTENTLGLLDRLVSHEQAETTLMQRSYTEDLGTP